MNIEDEYPYVVEASGEGWKSYYNSGNYIMTHKVYNATRYKTIEAASKAIDYIKSHYDDSVAVAVVDYKTAYKEYRTVYED